MGGWMTPNNMDPESYRTGSTEQYRNILRAMLNLQNAAPETGFNLFARQEAQVMDIELFKIMQFRQSLGWSPSQWKELDEANALDIELFDYAKQLNKIDNQVFTHVGFAKASATM